MPFNEKYSAYQLEGHSIWVFNNFSQSVLHVDPASLQQELEKNYPVRGKGDQIEGGVAQWVSGQNSALNYRGNDLKRGKMWFQIGEVKSFFLRYGYTGWQWAVLRATACVDKCSELAPVVHKYNTFVASHGFDEANHFIVTKYQDGKQNIGFHSDKAKDIKPGSLITVVKIGSCGRPFEIRRLAVEGEKQNKIKPFFSQILAPGTAVIMTLEANLSTQHGVPVVDGDCGPSGSIVFRTITKKVTFDKANISIAKAVAEKVKRDDNKRARDEQV